MKELKFRVWDVRDKRMIHLDTYMRFGFINHILEPQIRQAQGSKEIMLSTNPEYFIWMQYTGLADNNGVNICEGDMDAHGNVVEYTNGCYCLNGDRPLCIMAKNFEVVGNIYEHPLVGEALTKISSEL
jgi:hypothetical protein